MTIHDPDPLTPEERELAARLARIGPHGMPSPALDARILGAAQAAAARKPIAGRQRRWPAWAGIAATLALSLGAVWQLRPVQEEPIALDEAPSSAAARRQSESVMPGEAPDARNMISGNGQAEPESSAKATAASPPPAPEALAAKVAPPEPRARAMPQPSPVPPAPVVFDDPSPITAPAPVAAPAPPPPPPPARAHAQPAPAAATAPSRHYQPAAPAAPMPRESTAAATMESAASGVSAVDIPADARVTVTDLPVASDRTLAPVDWIERIRQRREAGDLAGARASLALLQRDHPQLVLPDDVRTLAAPALHPDR